MLVLVQVLVQVVVPHLQEVQVLVLVVVPHLQGPKISAIKNNDWYGFILENKNSATEYVGHC